MKPIALMLLVLFQQPVTTGTLHGRIYDDKGEPARDAYVHLLMLHYDNVTGARILDRPISKLPVRTNDKGEYEFPFIVPGDYYLRAIFQDAATYFPRAARADDAVPIHVSAGADQTIDLTLQSPSS